MFLALWPNLVYLVHKRRKIRPKFGPTRSQLGPLLRWLLRNWQTLNHAKILPCRLQAIENVYRLLLCFCAPAPHFSPPHLWSPQISPCSPGSRWMALGQRRAKVLIGLIVRAIIFQDFQPMLSWSTNITGVRVQVRVRVLKMRTRVRLEYTARLEDYIADYCSSPHGRSPESGFITHRITHRTRPERTGYRPQYGRSCCIGCR